MSKIIIYDFEKYSKTLPIARNLYENIFPKPTTHIEYMDSFNKIGKINEIIINTIEKDLLNN